MPEDPESQAEEQDPGQAMALLALLTLLAVLSPLFAFLQGVALLLTISGVTAVAAGGLALYALAHGRVDGEEGSPQAEPAAERPLTPEEVQGRLRQVEIFHALNDEDLQVVAALGQVRRAPAGERLREAGAPGETIYVVLEGHLKLLSLKSGTERSAGTAKARQAVPLVGLLSPTDAVTGVRAVTDSLVFTIPRPQFLELCESQPALGMQVYRAAAGIFARRYRSGLQIGRALRPADAAPPTSP